MENRTQNSPVRSAAAFFSFANHPFKLRLYLLKNLPAAFFSGVRVVAATEDACTVSVPYKRFTQNPFRSTYFACLSMAAELSTGLLAMAKIYGRKPSVSMLITGMEARFHKKAKGLSFFTCTDGCQIRDSIETAVTSGEGQQIKAYSVGKNSVGEVVAEFWFSWSFKRK